MMSFFTKDEFVVRFDFFIWCFFSPCLFRKHIRDCLSHIQEDNGVYYIAEYLSPDSIDTPLFEGQALLIIFVYKK